MVLEIRRPRVVIVGGGFGGIKVAQTLEPDLFEVMLIDKRNFHLFQPLLYQVATGALAASQIASPLRGIFRGRRDVKVVCGEVIDIDMAQQEVVLRKGRVHFDYLVMAAGAVSSYFGHDSWATHSFGLKSVEDAFQMRAQLFKAFEEAELASNSAERRRWLTFAIIGGGPTGVELAGALSEIAKHVLVRDFRSIDTREVRVILVNSGERLLKEFHPDLSRNAEVTLRALGVDVRMRRRALEVEEGQLVCSTPEGGREIIEARTVLWAAGVAASPLGAVVAERCGAQVDDSGRVMVSPILTVGGYPNVFVVGDLAHVPGEDGQPLPGVAPVATSEGRYVGRAICRMSRGEIPEPYRYHDQPHLAVIGRNHAVMESGWLRCSGFPAWMIWAFVHILFLIEWRNRAVVFLQWVWSYLTFQLHARLVYEPGSSDIERSPSGISDDPSL